MVTGRFTTGNCSFVRYSLLGIVMVHEPSGKPATVRHAAVAAETNIDPVCSVASIEDDAIVIVIVSMRILLRFQLT